LIKREGEFESYPFCVDIELPHLNIQHEQKCLFYGTAGSNIRLHLMSYNYLFDFLNNPEKLSATSKRAKQLKLPDLQIVFKT
jgi:hypothetical protein